MLKVHHAGKMGDVIYALPVMRALSRTFDEKIHLTTSGMCWQLVPLLWEQPYFGEIAVDDTRAYSIPKGGVTVGWDYYADGEGLNLSLQPQYYESDCPINWTMAVAKAAGLPAITPADMVALPSLVNHRRWHFNVTVAYNGQIQRLTPTIVVAPEVESLDPADDSIWGQLLAKFLSLGYRVVRIGRRQKPEWIERFSLSQTAYHDLGGATTVAAAARLIAEAQGFVGAHSFPWHLARHAETPAICLQGWREGLRRCVPIDSDPLRCPWVDPEDWERAVEWIVQQTVVHP